MAISSISGVASVPVTRPVDPEHQRRSRRETAQDQEHEAERAKAETQAPNADDAVEEVAIEPSPDGVHHIHVIA
jgi:hypothetical protein